MIVQQRAIIERLEKRFAQLEGRVKSGGSRTMPGLEPKGDRKPGQPNPTRKAHRNGFARVRTAPARRVEHAL